MDFYTMVVDKKLNWYRRGKIEYWQNIGNRLKQSLRTNKMKPLECKRTKIKFRVNYIIVLDIFE